MHWLTFLISSGAILVGLTYDSLWPPLTISRETTFITQPLLADGWPDYLTWAHERYGQGVTLENNAAIVLPQLDGGREISRNESRRRGYFETWGIPVPTNAIWVSRSDFENDQQELQLDDKLSLIGVATRRTPFDPQQHPAVLRYLEMNAEALKLVGLAMQRPRFYLPPPEGTPRGVFNIDTYPYGSLIFELRIAYQLRYEVHRHHGDIEHMIEDALALVRLGRMYQLSPGSLCGGYGQSTERAGIRLLGEMLGQRQCTAQHISQIRKAVQQLPAAPTMAERLDGMDRIYPLARIIELRQHPPLKPVHTFGGLATIRPGVSVNDLLRACNAAYDERKKIASDPNWVTRSAAIDNLPSSFEGLEELQDARQPIEKVEQYLPIDIPIFFSKKEAEVYCYPLNPSFLYNEMTSIVSRDLLSVGLDVAEFSVQQQRLPRELSELMPAFRADIPRDRWTGQPLRYVTGENSFFIYSTGSNGRDDDGEFIPPDLALRKPVVLRDDLSFGMENSTQPSPDPVPQAPP